MTTAMPSELFVGIDAGGTSWKLIIADAPDNIVARERIPTTNPDRTLAAVADWIRTQKAKFVSLSAIGLASFGPVLRDPESTNWGEILDTPKPHWRGINPRRELEEKLGLPCALETDVNAAILAEHRWGHAKGLDSAIYITIGTGVGGGVLIDGALAGAPYHPELGHVHTPRSAEDRAAFTGTCPFHGDCVEGLIAAPAFRTRWGCEPKDLPDTHPAWTVFSETLAHLCVSLTYSMAPQRIILGGGLMQRPSLLDLTRENFTRFANGYGLRPEACDTSTYLVRPGLCDDAGALGGLAIAQAYFRSL